jgi:hypothetical protein
MTKEIYFSLSKTRISGSLGLLDEFLEDGKTKTKQEVEKKRRRCVSSKRCIRTSPSSSIESVLKEGNPEKNDKETSDDGGGAQDLGSQVRTPVLLFVVVCSM